MNGIEVTPTGIICFNKDISREDAEKWRDFFKDSDLTKLTHFRIYERKWYGRKKILVWIKNEFEGVLEEQGDTK